MIVLEIFRGNSWCKHVEERELPKLILVGLFLENL